MEAFRNLASGATVAEVAAYRCRGDLGGAILNLMRWETYVAAYLIACVGGFCVIGTYLYCVRKTIRRRSKKIEMESSSFELVDFLVGGTERAVALTLVLWAPPYVPTFIGGWVLLKFALGWQRTEHSEEGDTGSLLALTANVFSFAIAIGVGVYLNHEALNVWAATPH